LSGILGPAPSLKHATEVSRLASLIRPISLFHLTSPSSRSHASYKPDDVAVLPPLVFSATIDASRALGVESVFAAEEADRVCVSIARERNGFITGQDSDFVVFANEGEGGVRGYVPMDEMVWDWVETVSEEPEEVVEPGFEKVKAPRRRSPKPFWRNGSPLPPPVPHVNFITSLTLTTYHPSLLADHLQLPLSLLPLFAALVGNDLYSLDRSFHPSGLNGLTRLERVASSLRECLNPKLKRSPKNSPTISTSGDTALSLLTEVVTSLSLYTLTEDQIDIIIHQLIDSALSYALPNVPDASTVTASSTAQSAQTREEAIKLYTAAFADGDLSPKIAGVIREGRFLSKPWLEDTQRTTIAKKAGDGIRDACWAVLHEAVGIGYDEPVEVEVEEVETKEESKTAGEDDVAEEKEAADGDEVAVEDGEAEAAMAVDDAGTEKADPTVDGEAEVGSPPSPTELAPPPPPVVQTYFRSSSLYLPKLIPILPITGVLDLHHSSTSLPSSPDSSVPLVLQPIDHRLRVFLHFTSSLTPKVEALPIDLRPLVVALRWMLHALAEEGQSGMKDRPRKVEIEALLVSGSRSVRKWNAWAEDPSTDPPLASPAEVQGPEISQRAVHLTSFLLHSLHETSLLAQTLLLPSTLFPPPHRSYSGKDLHTLLASKSPTDSLSTDERADLKLCIAAVLDYEGTEKLAKEAEEVAPGVSKARAKKDRKKAKEAEGKKETAGSSAGGMFAALGDMDE
jgi:hypothetical protein